MRPAVYLLFALLTLTMTARAGPPPPALGQQRVPLGDGRTLTVSAPRRLTFNAGTDQFHLRPETRDAVYVGTVAKGRTVTQTVCIINVDAGETRTLLSTRFAVSPPDPIAGYSLMQWSGDARYLLVSFNHYGPAGIGVRGMYPDAVSCVDMDAVPVKVTRFPLPDNAVSAARFMATVQPLRSGNLFASAVDNGPVNGERGVSGAMIYDPTTDTTRRVALPNGYLMGGWTDDTHLLLSKLNVPPFQLLAHNICTGRDEPTNYKYVPPSPTPSVLPGVLLSLSNLLHDVLTDSKRNFIEFSTVQLNITASKRALPPVTLANCPLTHDTQAVLTSDQSAAVWIQNGDLYACAFAVVPATDADRAAMR